MKKKAIIVLLIWCLFVCFLWPYRPKSYADPFTAGQIASTAYAMMQSWGISFTAGSATASGMNSFMSSQVEDYVNSKGGSIADVFIGQIAVDAAGKLVVAHEMYNSVIEFVDWLKEKYDLSSVDFSLSNGEVGGKFAPYTNEGSEIPSTGWYVYTWNPSRYGGFKNAQLYINGVAYPNAVASASDPMMFTSTRIDVNGNYGGYYIELVRGDTGKVIRTSWVTGPAVSHLNTLSWNGSEYIEPTVLNPDKEWTGTIGGYSSPDTNLDQLMSGIDQSVADNNLLVDGEVIDVPIPPTPIPTIEPGDIDGYWNRQADQLEGLGNDIGDISGKIDDLGQQAGDITDALEGVNEGIQTQTGVISGALDQAKQDVIDAIGEQTGVLDESLTQTAEGVQEIADALQPGEIEPRQFDLRRLFPFCIPFDIHNLLQKFNAEPIAPHVQLPFVIQSIGFSYIFDLDFSVFDPVAAAMRTVEFIVFAIGLAWATSKVIKW